MAGEGSHQESYTLKQVSGSVSLYIEMKKRNIENDDLLSDMTDKCIARC